jgi:hypothetical protein
MPSRPASKTDAKIYGAPVRFAKILCTWPESARSALHAHAFPRHVITLRIILDCNRPSNGHLAWANVHMTGTPRPNMHAIAQSGGVHPSIV